MRGAGVDTISYAGLAALECKFILVFTPSFCTAALALATPRRCVRVWLMRTATVDSLRRSITTSSRRRILGLTVEIRGWGQVDW